MLLATVTGLTRTGRESLEEVEMKEMLPTVNLDEGAAQCSPRAPQDEASRPVRAGKVDLRIFHFRICGPDLGAVGEMRLDGD